MNEDNTPTNTPSAEEELNRLIDIGSYKVFNKSIQEFKSLCDNLGVPLKTDVLFVLSCIGKIEDVRSRSKAAE